VALPAPSNSATALVTGASSGIGEQFARGLARRGHGVTLVARRGDVLERLAAELSREHGVRADHVATDLADSAQRDVLAEEVVQRDRQVDILVNCAGFGLYGPFVENGRERELQQVRLLVEAVVDLTARYLPGMVERDTGAVINVSSTAGIQPLPHNAAYAAAKSYVDFLGDAIHSELQGTGVTVTTVLPGPVRSGFQEASDAGHFADRMPGLVFASPERVAEDGLKAAERGKRSVVPGGLPVRAAFRPNRFAPRRAVLAVSKRMMARPDAD
jgi:short-subunit dehydrogenase